MRAAAPSSNVSKVSIARHILIRALNNDGMVDKPKILSPLYLLVLSTRGSHVSSPPFALSQLHHSDPTWTDFLLSGLGRRARAKATFTAANIREIGKP